MTYSLKKSSEHVNITYVYEYSVDTAKLHDLPRYGITKNIKAPTRMLYMANRIWVIDSDNSVRYAKNRNTGIMTPVNHQELTLVLLQAVVL